MPARGLPAPITVEQYERFVGYPGLKDELIYGEIVLSPQPKPLPQQIAETHLRFGAAHSTPAPDVLLVPVEAWREACRKNQYLSAPPLVVAEVLSLSNRSAVMAKKVRLYLEQGVKMVLVIQPKARQLACHQANQDVLLAAAEDQITLPQAGVVSLSTVFVF